MLAFRFRTVCTLLSAGSLVLLVAACAGEAAPGADAAASAGDVAASPSATVALSAANQATAQGIPQVTVYKTPTCGCCEGWVDHLRQNGFAVIVHDQDDLSAVKAANGITPQLESCHTAIVDGYVVEGHVPADLVAKLLAERPDIAGLAVPGMPGGTPGMESAPKEAYQVLAIGKDGRTTVYANR